MRKRSTIRELRRARGWSRAYLAEKADVHENTIGRLERNKTDARISGLFRIADELSVTVDDLFICSEKPR